MIRNELGYMLFTRAPIRLANPSARPPRADEIHPFGQPCGSDLCLRR